MVICSNCGAQFEMDSREWDRSRKPWCSRCAQQLTIGSKYIPRNDKDEDTRRKQARANRRWFKNSRDAANGVVKVKKDWKEIKDKR